MFTIGETRPNCDANEPQEDAQGTRPIRRGRLNNETQREQRRRRRAKTKDSITSNQLSTYNNGQCLEVVADQSDCVKHRSDELTCHNTFKAT